MFLLVLTIMPKRFKYFVSAVFSVLGFFMFISLPYESRYFGLMAGIVLVIFCFWFGLGILFEKSFYTRMMAILLPLCFFIGFGMFVAFLPYSTATAVLASIFFGMILYTLFLVENVFLVAIGFKTVPLYRAAYTVGLIVMLMAAFFLFDSLYSFRLNFIWNTIWVYVISSLLFLYQFWAISIELPDDGKNKNIKAYVFLPALMVAEMALIFSFWPTGIFKGSMYLVSIIYLIYGLIQSEIRDRLFKRVWMMYVWLGAAILLAIVTITKWR